MNEIITIIILLMTLIILKFGLNIKFKPLKELNSRTSEGLKIISNKFSDDEKMCRYILKMIKNENVKVKVDKKFDGCLYNIVNNTITIGKFKEDYIKPQTIAHECIHSTQSKNTLWFNFIISNISNIYFFVIMILTLFNKIEYTSICTLILLMLGIIKYVLRNYLENDAMIRARFLSEKYLEEKDNITEEEKEKLLKEYDYINSIGIPFYNFSIISGVIIKVIIYSIAIII